MGALEILFIIITFIVQQMIKEIDQTKSYFKTRELFSNKPLNLYRFFNYFFKRVSRVVISSSGFRKHRPYRGGFVACRGFFGVRPERRVPCLHVARTAVLNSSNNNNGFFFFF